LTNDHNIFIYFVLFIGVFVRADPLVSANAEDEPSAVYVGPFNKTSDRL
jgi:hypothetical protein